MQSKDNETCKRALGQGWRMPRWLAGQDGYRLSRGMVCIRAWFCAAVIGLTLMPALAAQAKSTTLDGTVQSGSNGLSGYQVSLYAAFVDSRPDWVLLGSDTSDKSGDFTIKYKLPQGREGDPSVLFVLAERGQAQLAAAIGTGSMSPDYVVINERTTVATGNAFAQFIRPRRIAGNTYGMLNGVPMAANFADPKTGTVGLVLRVSPNGTETSALPTFNSLSNAVASCVASAANCRRLFDAATPPGGAAPLNVLQALSNIVKNPAYTGTQDPVFALSLMQPTYRPALDQRPNNWLLFLKITGGFYSAQTAGNMMNGPGNFAIDEFGNVWLNENYEPRAPDEYACAGHRLMKFYPWGQSAPWSPYFGGGLSGAGWGITIDLDHNIWVGNFGFQNAQCETQPDAAPSNAVSKFRPNGVAITGSNGYTQGNISWPMGTVTDYVGNIWIANCGNDSITKYPGGDPTRAVNFPLGAVPAPGDPQIKPFAVAIDANNNVWVTDNRAGTVSILSPSGTLIDTITNPSSGSPVYFSHPIGSAFDSKGNLWVANSDWLDAPCPTTNVLGQSGNSSVTMIQGSNHKPSPRSPFKGGGIKLLWGIAVDGDDTIWAFNFGQSPPLSGNNDGLTSISHLCGVDTSKCPAGLRTGDPISPDTGYESDAFVRITSGAIDPSGNIWITGNWKIRYDPLNPGGNSISIAVGAAAPLKTPLIGLPRSFN